MNQYLAIHWPNNTQPVGQGQRRSRIISSEKTSESSNPFPGKNQGTLRFKYSHLSVIYFSEDSGTQTGKLYLIL